MLNARRVDELRIRLEGKLGVMKSVLAEVVSNIKNATGPDIDWASESNWVILYRTQKLVEW